MSDLGVGGCLVGKLLVATPSVEDPDFHRTVVLVLEHCREGAIGVVLNRPTRLEVAEPLPAWACFAVEPSVLFKGGPVSTDSALCLALRENDRAVAGVASVDLNGPPSDVHPPLEKVRVFAGYTGWKPRQVEAEIIAGGWFVVDAWPGDALSPEPDDLWWKVLARQTGKLRRFGNFPLDPALN